MPKFRFATMIFVATTLLITSCANTEKVRLGFSFENPARSNIVFGNVINQETGEPIIGCPVQVEGTTFGALTDVYGTYTIYDVPNGRWSISAKMVGYSTKTDSVTVGQTPAIANFQLEESEVTIGPVIVRWAISCGPNGCTIWTPATDSAPAQSRPLNGNPIKLDKIFTQNTGTITGKVIDKKTKEAMIGYPVQIDSLALGAFTDIDGIYTIKEVPHGTHNLSSKAVGYQFQIKKVVVDEKPSTVDFELEESEVEIVCGLVVRDTRKFGTVTGRVIYFRTDEPMPGITVQIGDTRLRALTDTAGFYSIKSVPCGFQKISLITARGKEFTQDVVVSSKTAIVNFRYINIGS